MPTQEGTKFKWKAGLWITGTPVVEKVFAPEEIDHENEEAASLRKEMKHAMGLKTRWDQRGLVCHVDSRLLGRMTIAKQRREKARGEMIHHAIQDMHFKKLIPRDSRGTEKKWKAYKKLLDGHKVQSLKDILQISYIGHGKVLVEPQTVVMPMESRQAHMFRELALSLLAQFPELVFKPADDNKLCVNYALEGPHHRFWVEQSTREARVHHGWAFTEQEVKTGGSNEEIGANIATLLKTQKEAVWVTPHPALTHMRPVWAGKRRWCRTRKEYKSAIGESSRSKAAKEQYIMNDKLAQENKALSGAIEQLKWKQVHRMHGVTAYQKQNVIRMKMGRLRLWRGKTQGYACDGARCANESSQGQAHLLWECPDARAVWGKMMAMWELPYLSGDADTDMESMQDIFALTLSKLPQWLIDWGNAQKEDRWNELHEVAAAVWTMGCATMITALWRWKVSESYPDGNARPTETNELQRTRVRLQECLLRYRVGLFPLTDQTHKKLLVVDRIRRQWAESRPSEGCREGMEGRILLGFFDGGSRGNPGPGGSGSVLVEWKRDEERYKVVWAAATSLNNQNMTNNVAEFVGLQRLLAEATARKWRGLQVIGDSAMILGLLKRRKEPKVKRLKHWYGLARRLADQLQITGWKHHYRRHNKTADWLANFMPWTQVKVQYTELARRSRGMNCDKWWNTGSKVTAGNGKERGTETGNKQHHSNEGETAGYRLSRYNPTGQNKQVGNGYLSLGWTRLVTQYTSLIIINLNNHFRSPKQRNALKICLRSSLLFWAGPMVDKDVRVAYTCKLIRWSVVDSL
ncbi:hypothetical protein DVH05_001455 [Phytophthora capsici]|nr:hypothetical protein DVH05_001455 [Phytophthora capsici]